MAKTWKDAYDTQSTTTFQSNDIFYLLRSPYGATENFGFLYSSLIPVANKGDLYTFSTVNAALSVGNDGEYILANSGTATGLEWTDTMVAPFKVLGNVDDIQVLTSDVDTDSTNKLSRFATRHYDNAEEPFVWAFSVSTSTFNTVSIGGGTGFGNAATSIQHWAAADTTTTLGTQITDITTSGVNILTGGLAVGFSATPSADVVSVGDSNFNLNYNSGNPSVTMDSGDTLVYDRTANSYTYNIASTAYSTLSAAGQFYPSSGFGLSLGRSTLSGNLQITDPESNAGAKTYTSSSSLQSSLSIDVYFDSTNNDMRMVDFVNYGWEATGVGSNSTFRFFTQNTGSTTLNNVMEIQPNLLNLTIPITATSSTASIFAKSSSATNLDQPYFGNSLLLYNPDTTNGNYEGLLFGTFVTGFGIGTGAAIICENIDHSALGNYSGNLSFTTTYNGTLAQQYRMEGTGNMLFFNTRSAPSAPTDGFYIYSTDISAGNTKLGLYFEGSGLIGSGTPTQNTTVQIDINGTTYYLLASTSAS